MEIVCCKRYELARKIKFTFFLAFWTLQKLNSCSIRLQRTFWVVIYFFKTNNSVWIVIPFWLNKQVQKDIILNIFWKLKSTKSTKLIFEGFRFIRFCSVFLRRSSRQRCWKTTWCRHIWYRCKHHYSRRGSSYIFEKVKLFFEIIVWKIALCTFWTS